MATYKIVHIEEYLNDITKDLETLEFTNLLDFNDEIVSIEEVGEIETVDITLENNHMFYANGILTHNSGYGNRDAGMENVSDSIGIAQTADTFCILVRTKELDEENKAIFNFVKNRNTGILSNCLVGIDFPKMRFYDLEEFPEQVSSSSTNNNTLKLSNKIELSEEDMKGIFD